jgi:NADH:ubiquinone oxidoreductase subunit E
VSGLRVKRQELKELIREALLTPYKNIKLDPEDLAMAKVCFPHICYLCGEPMLYCRPKVTHFNKEQKPSKKFFCSKSCRDEWMVLVSRTNYDPALNDLIKNVEMINVWTKLKLSLT